jgi:hypothetical protein
MLSSASRFIQIALLPVSTEIPDRKMARINQAAFLFPQSPLPA